MGFSVSSSSPGISVERPSHCAGTGLDFAAPAAKSSAPATETAARAVNSAAFAPIPVEVVSVIERVAPRVIPVVVVNYVSVMPIKSPMMPSPSITSEPTDSEPVSEGEVRAAKPNSRIWIPSRPRHDGISVNHPRIVRGDENYIGAGGLNTDRRVFVGYGLLGRGFKIADFSRSPAHNLYRIHDVRLLVIVSVA